MASTAPKGVRFAGAAVAAGACAGAASRSGSGEFVIELGIDREYQEYLTAQVEAALADEELEKVPLPSLIGCLGWAASVMVGGSAYLCALREFDALQKKVRKTTTGWNFAARTNAKKRIAELLACLGRSASGQERLASRSTSSSG